MIKTILKEKINLDELKEFTGKKRTTHITNAKNNNAAFKCDVLDLRLTKVRAFAKQYDLKDINEILDTVPGDEELGRFVNIGRESIFKARKSYEAGKKVYAYKLHLMTYQLDKINQLIKENKL